MAGDTGRSGSVYGGASEPCTVVLFGASGDLAKRKVIPAMYDLATHNALGPRYVIVGFARTPMSEDAFRSPFRSELLGAHHHRETLWAGSGVGEGFEPDCPQRFRRKAGLPYRSLPGQRHGAEPARAALWQRDIRASLEPELRRSRANHCI